jgi:hypothetical protein
LGFALECIDSIQDFLLAGQRGFQAVSQTFLSLESTLQSVVHLMDLSYRPIDIRLSGSISRIGRKKIAPRPEPQ